MFPSSSTTAFDSNGFFTPERRAIAQAAADSLTSRMSSTSWARVDTSTLGGSYELAIVDPSTMNVSWVTNVVIPANQITVRLGAMDWSTAPVSAFRDSSGDSVTQLVSIRNVSGGVAAVLTSSSKFRPVDASISFDLQGINGLKPGITRQWYFGSAANLNTDDRNPAHPYYNNYSDFYTSMIHELGHILGIYDPSAFDFVRTSDPIFYASMASDPNFCLAWTSRVQSDGSGGYVFTGPRASQFYFNHIGQLVPLLSSGRSHWGNGVHSQPAGEWPSVTHDSVTAFRWGFSELDFAALEDVGYTISANASLSAPSAVSATAGDAQATVAFAASSSNGGGIVTGYTVTSSPSGITATGTSSPLQVKGLTNGIAYTFTVTATSSASAGTSVPSPASNSVTPTAPAQSYTVDIRAYIPEALSSAGYRGFLRVINSSGTATPVTVALIDGDTGSVGTAGTLAASLAPGAAVTYSAIDIEQALGTAIAASSRPRIRVGTQQPIEVQSFMANPGGIMTQISGAQSGTTIDVRSYLPSALSVSGYTSAVRVINTGSSTTAVRVAIIDGNTGAVGNSAVLNPALPPGAAITYFAQQIEDALGLALAASARPRLRVTSTTVIEVQSFMSNPGGAVTESDSVQ